MMLEMLLVFIVLTVFLLIMSVLLVDEYPHIASIIIIIGLLLSVLVSFGFFKVEHSFSGFNATSGNMEFHIYNDTSYQGAYPIVGLFLGLVFTALLIRVIFNYLKDSTEGIETMGDRKKDDIRRYR